MFSNFPVGLHNQNIWTFIFTCAFICVGCNAIRAHGALHDARKDIVIAMKNLTVEMYQSNTEP